jgi:zeaxanthin glucosyltransferase
MHFGIISPPVSGHIHPFGALGRELIARGHRVSLLHMPDLAPLVEAQGLEFISIGQSDHPAGTLPQSLARLGQLDGLAALRFTIQAIRRTTEMMCRDAPDAIREHGIDALLVDQTEPAGGTVAEHLAIPFVTICNALALNRESEVPPPFTGWSYRRNPWVRTRNRLGYAISDRIMRPVTQILGRYRRKWDLPSLQTPESSFSALAQISQTPAAFDFPRRELPQHFHYVGPLRNPAPGVIPFPWEKLDGRPLIYASLGTLQNAKERIFRCFAEACLELDFQLVITHGGGLGEDVASSFPGNPLVVSYAPQLEVLRRARITLTHAGLNTVLDSLACGVPLVAVPITYEQPAIASRIRWTGVGEVLPLARLNAQRLRESIQQVANNPSYTSKARAIKTSIEQSGGVQGAANLIEKVVL